MKKLIYAIIVLILFGFAIGYYLFNKPHKDYSSAQIELSISAHDIFRAYNEDELRANQLYQDKVIAVSGIVSGIDLNQKKATIIYLESDDPLFGIQFTMLPSDSSQYLKLKKGDKTTLKGLCVGFTNDVVFTNATVVVKD